MWTMDNTEGFTQDDINILNAALEQLASEFPGVETYSINDALNNAWHDGITAEELTAAARKQLG